MRNPFGRRRSDPAYRTLLDGSTQEYFFPLSSTEKRIEAFPEIACILPHCREASRALVDPQSVHSRCRLATFGTAAEIRMDTHTITTVSSARL
jgi:hypothetical protein